MAHLFARDRFDYPVFMDTNGAINQLNRFPKQMEYQCFLLDKDNKVVMVGNPVLNMNIWELYKSQVAGGKETTGQEALTSATVDKTAHDFGAIRKSSSNPANFTMTNTGNHPLVIYRVSASCGCTNVEWERHPISPGKTVTIRVEMIPDETGYFSKTIDVHCNVKDAPIRLMVNGNVNEIRE